MIEEDTIKLLRGMQFRNQNGGKFHRRGPSQVRPVPSFGPPWKKSRSAHSKLGDETHSMLAHYGDEGKEPSPVAKGMSWMKTNVKLGLEKSDKTVADLITDGCNMGVKSLGRYLNQYEAAEEKAKDIAKRLIGLEEHLAQEVQPYL